MTNSIDLEDPPKPEQDFLKNTFEKKIIEKSPFEEDFDEEPIKPQPNKSPLLNSLDDADLKRLERVGKVTTEDILKEVHDKEDKNLK